MAGLDAFTPKGMMRLGLRIAEESAQAMGALAQPGQASIGFQEFRNKLHAFSLFEYVDSALHLGGRGGSLPYLATRAAQLNAYDAVWAAEGVGYRFAEANLGRGLLRGATAENAGSPAIVALHSGMGLALADRALRKVGARCCGTDLPAAVRAFTDACIENSRSGYSGAAIEAVGLVARNLYPQLIDKIDAEFARTDAELRDFFWHGLGRGLYFTPTTFNPFSSAPWLGADMAMNEAPDESARRNTVAGFAWALALVNIRQPEIVEAFLDHHARSLPAPAVRNGIASAILVWRHCSPGDLFIDFLLRHPAKDSGLWREFVVEPVNQALAVYDPLLSFGALFRYGELRGLVGQAGEPDRPNQPLRPGKSVPACGGLFEELIARPAAAIVSGIESLQHPAGVRTIDAIVSRVVHTLNSAGTAGDCRCGSGQEGGRHAGTD